MSETRVLSSRLSRRSESNIMDNEPMVISFSFYSLNSN